MKLKSLLPLLCLLLFIASCKKSDSTDQAPIKPKITFEQVPNAKNSVNPEGLIVEFFVKIANLSGPVYVSLMPEGGVIPLTQQIELAGMKNKHIFLLEKGTKFFVRAISSTGVTGDSHVVTAGDAEGMIIIAPN